MKKFYFILAAAMLSVSFTGCGKTDTDQAQAEAASKAPITYAQNDFALYSTDDDMQPVKFLCMLGVDNSALNNSDDETVQYLKPFIKVETGKYKVGDKENPGKTNEEELVNYFSYLGSHKPVINVKGITTTGIVKDDDKCSTADDVIKAYGIDKDNEEYIISQGENNDYTIQLNFKDSGTEGVVDRIVTKKGDDLSSANQRYSLRFNIINNHVHGIEGYMYN